MKNIFLTAFAALFCATSFAADDWKTYFKNEQVEIQYRHFDCHDKANGIHQQKILLKFINTSNEKKEISFSKEVSFTGTTSISVDIKNYSIQLQPKEAKEGLCSDKNKALFIFSKHLNFKSRELGKFELKNISVKTIQ